MAVIGRAPAVIPVPELSEEEQRSRLHELETAFELYQSIQSKVAKLGPALQALARDFVRLQHLSSSSPALRAVRVLHHLKAPLIFKAVVILNAQIGRIMKDMDKSLKRKDILEREVLDPQLPGVSRDPIELRKMLRKMEKDSPTE